MTKDERIRFAFRRAAARVERAWTQGAYAADVWGRGYKGVWPDAWAVDASYALEIASKECELEYEDLRTMLLQALPEPYCSELFGIEHWNDAEGRSVANVVEVFQTLGTQTPQIPTLR